MVSKWLILPLFKNLTLSAVEAICNYLDSNVKTEDLPFVLRMLFKHLGNHAAVKYIRTKLPEIKQMIHGLNLKISHPNFVIVKLLLNGEPSPIEIVLKYRIFEEKKIFMIEILSVKATKQWAEILLNDFIIPELFPDGKERSIEISSDIYHWLR